MICKSSLWLTKILLQKATRDAIRDGRARRTAELSAESPSPHQQRSLSIAAGEFDVEMELAGDDDCPKNDNRVSESSSEQIESNKSRSKSNGAVAPSPA